MVSLSNTSLTHLLFLAFPLFVFSACHGDGNGHERGMMGGPDTSRLQSIYTSMEQGHGQIMARYENMESQMSSGMQAMYQDMRQMHGEANAMHQEMMSGEMMHRKGMMDPDTAPMAMMNMREGDQQMLAMHQGLAQMHRQAGREEMAQMHRKMTQRYQQALDNTPTEGAPSKSPAPPESEAISGAEVYTQRCATCHGSEGAGKGSAFPPLAGSEWVTEEKNTPIRVVLHGLQGSIQVSDRSYSGLMPAFGTRLSDEEIAQLLTYVRSSWGNSAPEVTAEEVREIRREYGGREGPWSPSAFE